MNTLTNKVLTSFACIFNKEDSSNSLKILKDFRLDRRRLQFQFQNDSTQFSCTVEAVNVSHQILVIGNVFPRLPSIRHFSHRKLLLSATNDGSRMQMTSKFLQPLIGECSDFLMLQLPQKLHKPQEQKALYSMSKGIQRARNNTTSSEPTSSSESQAA